MSYSAGRTEIAVQALVALAGATPARPLTLRELEALAPGSAKLLSSVLGSLCRARMAASRRGQLGGYWGIRPLDGVSLLEVVEAVSRSGAVDPDSVDRDGGDPFSAVWSAVEDEVREALGRLTIADLHLVRAVRISDP